MSEPTTISKPSSDVATRDESASEVEEPKIDRRVNLRLSTIDPSVLEKGLEHTVRTMLEALNDLIIIVGLFQGEYCKSRETLAAVNERTKLMGRRHYHGSASTAKETEPGFGSDPIEREAMEYLQEYCRGWRVGERYLVLSTLTDHMRFKGYVDRKGRPLTQSQVAELVKIGGKYKGRFD